MTISPHRHALRRGTAAQWTAWDGILGDGEEGYETDTGYRKTGDGSSSWSDLPYNDRGPAGQDGTDGTDGTDGAPGSGDLTFTDNGDGTGTISWNSGANSVTFPLLSSGLVAASVIPAVALTTVQTAGSQAAMLALTAQQGDVCVRTDTNIAYMLATDGDPGTLADWIQISQPGAVASVAGRTGAVTLTSADLTDATTVGKAVFTATNQANARSAIGAGTSSLAIGTTSSTAMAGNKTASQIGGVAVASGQSATLWHGTQSAYDALGSYDASTLYVVAG